ncbi:hypothetical protein TSUD_407340 [Trifolium subterraneum]|uniref:RNA-directed DNA polymerase n=1 Tax=Trifolium subterraneum TaxID=3900 RepID=A0A2Z6PH35_TRISU|nr:hypothetical protein TSUD_407340 [Trifolium subterraneum]
MFFLFLSVSVKVARRIRYKPTRVYNTRSRLRNKMSNFEEENHMLREQMITMQTEIEKLTSMVASPMATQNQAPAPVPQSSSTFVPPPVSSAPLNTPQFVMPEGYPWGMPVGFLGEESRPVVSEIPHVQSTVPNLSLLIHFPRMDDLQIKYDEIQKEMRALRGKDLFGQDAHELCLVPDVVVPHKFKVPDFEKYKGSTCPKAHLIMYARKMSTQTSNDKLLIHYFQDSLTGAALRWYMDLDRANVSSFNDLASAFIRQYNYNSYMAPDRDELRALAQKERESFKEYAQRWRELTAQIRPPVEEKELCKLVLHTLSPFFYEKMVGIVSRSFTEMVEMGMCLEEGVRQGRLIRENAPTNTAKKYGNSFSKKKESEVGMVTQGGPQSRYQTYQHVSAITPTSQPQMTQAPPPQYPHPYQQPYPQQPQIRPQTPQQPYNYPNRTQRNPPFDPIPMKYPDLLPALLAKKFVQTRPPPPVPADENPNVQNNLLPNHGSSVHFIQSCQETSTILSVKHIKTPLVPIHSKMCEAKLFSHDHATCEECLKNPQGCSRLQEDIQRLMDKGELVVTKKSEDVCIIVPEFNVSDRLEMIYNSGEPTVTPLVICLLGPMPYTSLRVVPYRYDATMLQDGVETPIPPLISVDNIVDNSKILRSGLILPGAVQGKTGSSVEKTQIPDSSGTGERVYEDSDEVLKMIKRMYEDSDEVLKMIKRSEYKIVDQLLQTPSKISILSLLMSSDAHRDALMKVLDQAYVDHDVTLSQFGSIVGNVTACNNLSFSDEELPERGRDHNLALHISVSCKFDSLSNVLVDTGSTLNVMSKITFDKLAYRGAPLRPSALIVKAFDGSRKSVIGEIDLPISVGPYEFQITFQVMDIRASYSCLLGQPWIHEAGAVTSTLHQKLKFVREGKLVIVNGEEALLVSHLSAFSYIGADVEDGTAFQGLSVEEGSSEKAKAPMKSVKDAQKVMQRDEASHWRRLLQLAENQKKEGLGCTPSTKMNKPDMPIADIFRGDGFINAPPETNAIIEHEEEEEPPSFVTPGGICCNWVTIDVPSVTPLSKLSINKPVELNDPRPSPNFEFPVYEVVEEEDEEIPDEIRRLLDQEKRTIQPHKEVIELINLGSEEEKKEIKIGAFLEASVKERVIVLLREYVDIFAWSYQDMPGLDPEIVEHHLPLKLECPPVKQKLRRTHPDMALKIKEEVQKQIDVGFLITSEYPQWLANIVPVPKKDGKVRMCVDYRDLNKDSPKDDFPLPHIDVLVDNTAKSKVFSFMDGFSEYNQIKIAVEDREKTAFITPWGTFCYKVMPFGLTNAGATYQRGMTTLFHDMMHKEIEVYVDNMIVKSGTEEEHVEYLLKMFQRMRKYRLRLNPKKCTFGVRSGKLLGIIVSQKGIEVDPDKVRAIREMPAQQTEKQVRGFLGRLNYISRFISHMTATCGPIFKLIRKNQGIVWTEDCQKAFDSIKEYLMEPPILIPPVEGRPLIMYLTVLEESMSCVLGQQVETGRKEHAIYYLSKKFTDCESRYSMLEKNCCALAWAAKRLRHYLINRTTWLISKMDPIKYIFEKAALTGRIARWQMLLSEYDIEYRTQKAIKGSILADHLAHQPVEDYQPIKFDFPDEEIMYLKMKDCDEPVFGEGPDPESKWGLIFDGAVNLYGSGIGAIIVTPKACIMGIEEAIDLRIKNIDIYGDSALVVNQLKGEWETRHAGLIPYRDYARQLLTFFNKVELHHIPRDENQMAGALATLSSMYRVNCRNEIPTISIRCLERPAYVFATEEVVDDKPWFHDIKMFLQKQEYPTGASNKDKKTLRRLTSSFFLNDEVLYKRKFEMVLLQCVDKYEADLLMHEVHEGSFGTHPNGHTMAKKMLRAGYYWLTMESDCYKHARKCHKCQIYADKIHLQPTSLNVLSSPWPFSMWGIDMIGQIEPKASNGHRFILVAIDYFTKWVEAASYANVTHNGTNLNNKMMKDLCDEFKIEHHNSSPYRPQMNGAVEAANKNIKKIVQKMVVTYKDWHEMLPFALHGYRTSVRTSTGATPFSLVYGMEAVLPVKVEIPSMRVLMETELAEAEWCQNRYDQLNLIEEKRMAALCHGQLYQRRMKQAFDRKVRPREFCEGDLVLKKILSFQPDSRGKWTPNYEGPYFVK